VADLTRKIVIEVLGDDKSGSKALSGLGDAAGTADSKMSKLGTVLGKAAVAIGGLSVAKQAAGFLMDSARAAMEDEQSAATLANTLQNVIGATNDQIAAAEAYILKTELATGVVDDKLRPAYSNLIVATKDATEAQDLMTIAMDTAQGRGLDLETVSKALAKAHDGNTGALSKLGIATKNAAGDTLTYDEILQNLASTYAGAVSANAETAAGKQQRLSVAFTEMKEQIGDVLLPALQSVVSWLTKLAGWFSNLPGPVKSAVVVVGGLLAVMVPLAPAISAVVGMLPALTAGLSGLGAAAAVATGSSGIGGMAAGAATAAGAAGLGGLAIAAGAATLALGLLALKMEDNRTSADAMAQKLGQVNNDMAGWARTRAQDLLTEAQSYDKAKLSTDQYNAAVLLLGTQIDETGTTSVSALKRMTEATIEMVGGLKGAAENDLSDINVLMREKFDLMRQGAKEKLDPMSGDVQDEMDEVKGVVDRSLSDLLVLTDTSMAEFTGKIKTQFGMGASEADKFARQIKNDTFVTLGEVPGVASTALSTLASAISAQFSMAWDEADRWARAIRTTTASISPYIHMSPAPAEVIMEGFDHLAAQMSDRWESILAASVTNVGLIRAVTSTLMNDAGVGAGGAGLYFIQLPSGAIITSTTPPERLNPAVPGTLDSTGTSVLNPYGYVAPREPSESLDSSVYSVLTGGTSNPGTLATALLGALITAIGNGKVIAQPKVVEKGPFASWLERVFIDPLKGQLADYMASDSYVAHAGGVARALNPAKAVTFGSGTDASGIPAGWTPDGKGGYYAADGQYYSAKLAGKMISNNAAGAYFAANGPTNVRNPTGPNAGGVQSRSGTTVVNINQTITGDAQAGQKAGQAAVMAIAGAGVSI